jgi:DNA-binding MarR family transcriptional regulator
VLIRVGRLVERRVHAALRDCGLTAAHYLALAHLLASPGCSRSELARGLQVSPQAAGAIAEHLLKAGLISRRTADDRIRIELTLTDCGRELLLSRAQPEVDKVNQEIANLFRPEHASFIEGASEHILTRLGDGAHDRARS